MLQGREQRVWKALRGQKDGLSLESEIEANLGEFDKTLRL